MTHTLLRSLLPLRAGLCLCIIGTLLSVVSPLRSGYAQKAEVYKLAVDDLIEISVDGEPELTKSLIVLPDGTISYPYVGQYQVTGLTLDAVKDHITQKLRSQILKPQVTVILVKRHVELEKPKELPSVSILGDVRTQGKIALKEGWRVLDILAASGGLTSSKPEWTSATIIKASGAAPVSINLARLLTDANPTDNLPLDGGEVILIKTVEATQTQVQVLGEVSKPGIYTLPANGSLISVILTAGGVTPQAALSKALVRRNGESIPIDLLPLIQPDTGNNAKPAIEKLEPGDTVFIPTKNVRRVAVMGAVGHQGPVDLPDGKAINVLEALLLASGPGNNADLKNAFVVRPADPSVKDGTPVKIEVNLDKALKEASASRFQTPRKAELLMLNAGDMLFVPDKASGNKFSWREAVGLLPLAFMFRR